MHVLRLNSGVECRGINIWRGSGMAPASGFNPPGDSNRTGNLHSERCLFGL